MTPDTTAYMTAGFVVILAGIVIYTLSLVIRFHNLRRRLK